MRSLISAGLISMAEFVFNFIPEYHAIFTSQNGMFILLQPRHHHEHRTQPHSRRLQQSYRSVEQTWQVFGHAQDLIIPSWVTQLPCNRRCISLAT
jgi:hypothetical protein